MRLDYPPGQTLTAITYIGICEKEMCLVENDIFGEEKTMNPKYEGLIVDDVVVGKSGKSFYIEWAAPKLGFGEITVVLGDDGKLHVYTECMSDEFVSLALSKTVEHMVREE